MMAYHDQEWGVPTHNDQRLFEFLILEGAQAGLSWQTILQRRDGYRQAFAGFDPNQIAVFGQADVDRLLGDPGIIRNRLKIAATISNAQAYLQLQQELGSFATYLWQFVDGQPIDHQVTSAAEIPTTSPQAESMSKDLKRRGFRFVGPTICYAYMQACGLVNDHELSCFRYPDVQRLGQTT